VRRPGYWILLEIDNRTRTITYIDSLYQGGAEYIRPLETYLQKLEEIRTQKQAGPWQRRTTTLGPTRTRFQVRVPCQTNSNYCGVYICSIADLLEREQDILLIRPALISQARRQLSQSMVYEAALPLIADDAGRNVSMADRTVRTEYENDIELKMNHGKQATDHHELEAVTYRNG
jgi:Ulp1 family protease